jgi:hypothetical protein
VPIPTPWCQLGDPRSGMLPDAQQNVNEIGVYVDPVESTGALRLRLLSPGREEKANGRIRGLAAAEQAETAVRRCAQYPEFLLPIVGVVAAPGRCR